MDPYWLPRVERSVALAPEALMGLALDVALQSARHKSGPFGAVVADAEGHVLGIGWNEVVSSHDSTAHAEIVALRRAQKAVGTHRLDRCQLFTSCAPCIQCYGAIYWSGVGVVYAAARKEDAEAIGFEEGPPMEELWRHAEAAKSIRYVADFLRDERALAPLRAYKSQGGVNYSIE